MRYVRERTPERAAVLVNLSLVDAIPLTGFPPQGQTIRPALLESPVGLDGLVLKAGDVQATHRSALHVAREQRHRHRLFQHRRA